MSGLKPGDIVVRKSYGGDVLFRVADEYYGPGRKKYYVLKGILMRIEADAAESDLETVRPETAEKEVQRSLAMWGLVGGPTRSGSSNRPLFSLFDFLKSLSFLRGKPGKILHIDSSGDFLEMSYKFYEKSNLKVTGKEIPENQQPEYVRPLLEKSGADVLVITGHDGIKKDAKNMSNLSNYRNSAYYIQSVKEARKFESSMDKLCIFAGACQSYFEGIMDAGANFASSPGRILIHALDPAKVAHRVALTDSRYYVTPEKIAEKTESGLKGIGGVRTRGHYIS
jgi:spore coat assembly protein